MPPAEKAAAAPPVEAAAEAGSHAGAVAEGSSVVAPAKEAPRGPGGEAGAAGAASEAHAAALAEGLDPSAFEEAPDFSGEPLEDRFRSKDLNRRCSAYAEAQAMMLAAGDGEQDVFQLFRQFLSACVAETLPKGQDAALSALAVYLELCPEADNEDNSHLLRLVRGLIEHKSIDKPKLQQLVPPIVMLVAEICECPVVLKEITECLAELEAAKKKTQGFFKKQVAFIIKLVYQLLAEFGITKMTPKLGYLPLVFKYAADSDRGIKEACYSVLVELAAWVGDISDMVKPMDEPQKKEFAKRLEATEQEPRKAKRFHRKEKHAAGSDSGAPCAQGAAQRPDTYDLSSAVDALKALPKGWCISKVFSMEKWKEKQLYLQELSSCLGAPRLCPSDTYSSIAAALVRLIKHESNIPVVTEAAKCMGLLAKGLRENFEKPARQLLSVTLARINDKSVWKQNVLIERVEQLLWSVPFEFFFDELKPSVVSKSLFAKKEAMSLLLRALDLPQVQHTCPDAAERYFAGLASAALPNIDDSDNGVRHEAAKFLVTITVRNISSPEVGPVLVDRIPTHRRVAFEEEWKKIAKDQPCPVSTMDSTGSGRRPITPRGGRGIAAPARAAPSDAPVGVGRSGGASRQASPLRERPVTSSPLKSRPASAGPVAGRGGAAGAADAVVPPFATYAARQGDDPGGDQVADTSFSMPEGVDVVNVMAVHAEMAEEIRVLRSAVQQLQQQNGSIPGNDAVPAACPSTAASSSRMRMPSGERGGPQLRYRAHSSQDRTAQTAASGAGLVRPTTPPPQRQAQCAYRAGQAPSTRPTTPKRMRPDGVNTSMMSTPSRDPCDRRLSMTSSCASPEPRRRVPSAETRGGMSRPGSSDAIRRRDGGGAGQQMRRSSSSGPFGLPGAATGAALQIDYPKVSKAMRQQRERGQYWGPEPIPAEYLAALKDAWRSCVDERLWRGMFCDKMDEQLAALQIWKEQGRSHFHTLPELIDLLLKYLTWMLFNTNTQIWKLVLEVLTVLLDGMAATGLPLTEREAQIVIPNLLERSGHNIGSIREGMCALLRRAVSVFQRIRVLPMLLVGLASKNKRSVACAMRTLADSLDRQVALSLARSQRDLKAIACSLDDKDAEVRRAAVNTVAQLSQYLDKQSFDKILKTLSAGGQQLVRAAAAGLVPIEDVGNSSMDSSFEAPARPRSQAVAAASAGAGASARPASPLNRSFTASESQAAPRVAPAPVPAVATASMSVASASAAQACDSPPAQRPSRLVSPSRGRPVFSPLRPQGPGALEAGGGGASLGQEFSAGEHNARSGFLDAEVAEMQNGRPRASLLSLAPEVSSPVRGLVDRLGQCSAEEFKTICASLTEHAKRMAENDAPSVAEALVSAMRMYFGHDGCVERCWPLAELVDEFCASRECIRPLPTETLRGLLRELMRNLNSNAWTKQLEMGDALLKKLNLSCVLLLQSISRQSAFSLLLSLGTDESEVVGSTLAVKCLKKLTKTLATCKRPEQEVPAVLEVLRLWLQRVHPRLTQLPVAGDRGSCSIVDAAVATVLEGVKAVAEAAYRTCSETARAWLAQHGGEEYMLLRQWLSSQDGVGEKENAPSDGRGAETAAVAGSAAKAKDIAPAKDAQLPLRRASSPAKVGNPCATRNTQA